MIRACTKSLLFAPEGLPLDRIISLNCGILDLSNHCTMNDMKQTGEIRFVDTTLRDGQLSLWASNMTTRMMLPIIDHIDAAGFEAFELISSAFFKKAVRDLKEDLWERTRLVAQRAKKTPLRADPQPLHAGVSDHPARHRRALARAISR